MKQYDKAVKAYQEGLKHEPKNDAILKCLEVTKQERDKNDENK